MKGLRLNYDVVLKDLFKHDRPTLLCELTGGKHIRQILNVEFALIERRADLVLLLEDGSILHLEFQTVNDRRMPYRMGIYGLFIGETYRCDVRQVVLYVGERRMRLADRVTAGKICVQYELLDVRELDTEQLLGSRCPGDWVLARLSREGTEKLRAIMQAANRLESPERERVLAQIGALSGLRRLSNRVRMECEAMGSAIDIEKNEFLKGIWDSGVEKGKQQGREEIVRKLLETRFGPLPAWADERFAKATHARLDRWAKKILTAKTLEGVLGRV